MKETVDYLANLGFHISKNDLFYIQKRMENQEINEIEVEFETVEYERF